MNEFCSEAVGHLGTAMGLLFCAVQEIERGCPSDAAYTLNLAYKSFQAAGVPIVEAMVAADSASKEDGGDE